VKRLFLFLIVLGLMGWIGWVTASRNVKPQPDPTVNSATNSLSVFAGATSRHSRTPAHPVPSQEMSVTNFLSKLLNGDESVKVDPTELQSFLEENHRSAESLLGAFRASGDRSFLKEAMEQAPNDPRVAFAAYHFAEPVNYSEPATPERRQLLEDLKAADPQNSLGNFLSARDYFKAGFPEKALAEMNEGLARTTYQDYSVEFIQNAEEAYLAAGVSATVAKVQACAELPLPHLAELKKLGQNLVDLANTYREAGDGASAQAALQLGVGLSDRLWHDGNQFLIQDLVGIATERIILGGMDPAAAYGADGQTVKDQLERITQEREALKAQGKQMEAILPKMSEQDLATYFDRVKLLGDTSAYRWAVGKYGQPDQ
jgi:hypothetical protein